MLTLNNNKNKKLKLFNYNIYYCFGFYFNGKARNLRNFIIKNKSVGKFSLNKKDYENLNKINKKFEKEIQFSKKFMHPNIFTWGLIEDTYGKFTELGVFNSITHSKESLGNENILLRRGCNIKGIESSYYNTSHIAIVNNSNVLVRNPNYNSSEIEEYIESNMLLQKEIDFDFEEKIDIIKNNIINSPSKTDIFMINQHFENCVEKVKGVCIQCIRIEEKYGIVKIFSDYIIFK